MLYKSLLVQLTKVNFGVALADANRTFPTGEVDHRIIGTVLGTGSRTSNGSITDQFAGDYVIVQLGIK